MFVEKEGRRERKYMYCMRVQSYHDLRFSKNSDFRSKLSLSSKCTFWSYVHLFKFRGFVFSCLFAFRSFIAFYLFYCKYVLSEPFFEAFIHSFFMSRASSQHSFNTLFVAVVTAWTIWGCKGDVVDAEEGRAVPLHSFFQMHMVL